MTSDVDPSHDVTALMNTITDLLSAQPLTVTELTVALQAVGFDMPADLITSCFVFAMLETGMIKNLPTNPTQYCINTYP